MPLFRRRHPSVQETAEVPREEWVEEEAPPRPPPPPAPPPRAWWPWLLVLLLLVAAGLVALYVLQQDDDEQAASEPPPATTATGEAETVTVTTEAPEAVRVPDVVGTRLPQALDRLEAAGLVGNPRGVFSEEPRGRVVAQRPPPGEQAERGAKVRLNVSKGAQRVDVPDVVTLARAEAEGLLREAGFEPRVFEVPAPDPKGTVVAQNPPGGARAAEGDRVRINVSTGQVADEAPAPAQIAVPDAVGLQLREASRQLRDAGLVVRVFFVPSREPQGTVVAQNPRAGESVRRGASIRLNVSEGPQPGARVTVPDVFGLTQEEAISELEAAGFVVEAIPEPTPDETEQGLVVRQEPEAGAPAPRGALVTIYVGEFTG